LDITLLHKLPKGEIKLAIGDVFAQPSIYYQKLQNRNLIKTNNEQTISLTLNLTSMRKLLVAILAFGLLSCEKELGGGDMHQLTFQHQQHFQVTSIQQQL
jgi:hypothetical protein